MTRMRTIGIPMLALLATTMHSVKGEVTCLALNCQPVNYNKYAWFSGTESVFLTSSCPGDKCGTLATALNDIDGVGGQTCSVVDGDGLDGIQVHATTEETCEADRSTMARIVGVDPSITCDGLANTFYRFETAEKCATSAAAITAYFKQTLPCTGLTCTTPYADAGSGNSLYLASACGGHKCDLMSTALNKMEGIEGMTCGAEESEHKLQAISEEACNKNAAVLKTLYGDDATTISCGEEGNLFIKFDTEEACAKAAVAVSADIIATTTTTTTTTTNSSTSTSTSTRTSTSTTATTATTATITTTSTTSTTTTTTVTAMTDAFFSGDGDDSGSGSEITTEGSGDDAPSTNPAPGVSTTTVTASVGTAPILLTAEPITTQAEAEIDIVTFDDFGCKSDSCSGNGKVINGTCVEGVGAFTCKCWRKWAGPTCSITKIEWDRLARTELAKEVAAALEEERRAQALTMLVLCVCVLLALLILFVREKSRRKVASEIKTIKEHETDQIAGGRKGGKFKHFFENPWENHMDQDTTA